MMTPDSGFVARIEVDTNKGFVPCGTGFLVSPQYVLTCAHVALGIDAVRWARWFEEGQTLTLARLNLRFSNEGRAEDRRGTVVEYFVPDMALIRLDEPVSLKPVRLITNIWARHEDAIREQGAVVLGFASVGPDELIESRIHRIVSSARTSGTGRLLDLQVEGGRAKGMSGSPMLIQVSDDWACLGMLYLGGEGAATSRLILGDTLLKAIAGQEIDCPAPLNADDCFACSNDAAGNALRQLGEDHRQWFLGYGDSVGRLRTSDEPIPLASVYVHQTYQEDRIKSLFETHSLRKGGMWVSQNERAAVHLFAAQSEDCNETRVLIWDYLSKARSRSQIIIIDTLDLIVGRGDKSLLPFLAWLNESNPIIITTCRPLEAQRLASVVISRSIYYRDFMAIHEKRASPRKELQPSHSRCCPCRKASPMNRIEQRGATRGSQRRNRYLQFYLQD